MIAPSGRASLLSTDRSVFPQKPAFRAFQNFTLEGRRTIIAAQMTKREAKRRLENLALETGHKRDYYVKRALVEFLERKEHLLGHRPTRSVGFSTLDEIPYRQNRFPI
jgi:hypothetical protein